MKEVTKLIMERHLQEAIEKYGLEGGLESIERGADNKIKSEYLKMFWERIKK